MGFSLQCKEFLAVCTHLLLNPAYAQTAHCATYDQDAEFSWKP